MAEMQTQYEALLQRWILPGPAGMTQCASGRLCVLHWDCSACVPVAASQRCSATHLAARLDEIAIGSVEHVSFSLDPAAVGSSLHDSEISCACHYLVAPFAAARRSRAAPM